MTRFSKPFFFLLFFGAAFFFVFSIPFWHSLATPSVASLSFSSFSPYFFPHRGLCFDAHWTAEPSAFPVNWRIFLNDTLLKTIPFVSPALQYCIPYSALRADSENIVRVSVGEQSIFFHAKPAGLLTVTEMKLASPPFETAPTVTASYPWTAVLFASVFFLLLGWCWNRWGITQGTLLFLLVFLLQAVLSSMLLYWLHVLWTMTFAWFFLGLSVAGLVWAGLRRKAVALLPSDQTLILVFVLGILFIACVQLFLPSHWTEWNVFYERQTQAIVQNHGLVLWDSVSFLGRPQSFVPGYFLLEADLAFLTGLPVQNVFSWILFLALFVFAFSVWAFAQKWGFSAFQSVLLLGFFWLLMFSFNNSFVSARHLLGTGLLVLSVLPFLEKKVDWLFAGIWLALAAFVQIPLLLWAGIAALVFRTAKGWWNLGLKAVFAAFISGFVFFLLLFAPLLLSAGWPNEAKVQEWGYGIGASIGFLANEQGPLVFGLMVFSLFAGIWFFRVLLVQQRVLGLALLIVVALHTVVSFRFNLLLAWLLGVFVLELFFYSNAEFFTRLSNRWKTIALVLILGSSLVLDISREPAQVFSSADFAPLDFLARSSTASEIVLADPYLGHATAFWAGRKTVADLYVEFSNAHQLQRAYDFFLQPDFSVLQDYNVSWVFGFATGSFSSANQFEAFNPNDRFAALDQVFSSQKYRVYHVPLSELNEANRS